MNHGRIFKEFIRKSLEMKHRDMFKLLEGEDGHVVVVEGDDDDDVKCYLPLRRRRALLTPHQQSAQKRRESKRESFVVSQLHFQGSVSTFPTVGARSFGGKQTTGYVLCTYGNLELG